MLFGRYLPENTRMPPELGASQTHVYFIVGDFGDDPGVVTALVGAEPTRAYRKGDLMPNTSHGVRYREAGWVLDSPLPISAHADEHFEALVQLLEVVHRRRTPCFGSVRRWNPVCCLL